MLIIYATETGEVLDNTGTNSVLPAGPADELAYVNTDARGIDRATVTLLRLHDDDDHDLVQQALHNYCHVDTTTGTLVVEGPYPSLTVDRDGIPADGATPAVVTYMSGRAPAEVTFDVNGASTVEPVAGGTAQIEVTAAAPGPVTVSCQGLSVTITATEVQP